MRIQSIGNYYVPKVGNVSNAKKGAKETSFTASLEDERAQTALFLVESREILTKYRRNLMELKRKAVHERHPDYDEIKRAQWHFDQQEKIVKNFENEYNKLNPSGRGFENDVRRGRELRAEYQRSKSSSSASDDGDYSGTDFLNDIDHVPGWDYSFYVP